MFGVVAYAVGAFFAHKENEEEDPRPEPKMVGLLFYARAARQKRFITAASPSNLLFAAHAHAF